MSVDVGWPCLWLLAFFNNEEHLQHKVKIIHYGRSISDNNSKVKEEFLYENHNPSEIVSFSTKVIGSSCDC